LIPLTAGSPIRPAAGMGRMSCFCGKDRKRPVRFVPIDRKLR
jgi:hypothetical protein